MATDDRMINEWRYERTWNEVIVGLFKELCRQMNGVSEEYYEKYRPKDSLSPDKYFNPEPQLYEAETLNTTK